MLPRIAFPALLHTGATLSASRFSVHASTVVGIIALAALYHWCVRVHARNGGAPIGREKPTLLAVALLTLFLSLNGWLHDLSDYYLFSAHMVQHLLLALVIAPLLIMATPGWMLRPALAYPPVRAVAAWMTNPLRAFAIFNVVMAAWHLPPLYNMAMA